jgi:hypothetical protein
MKNILIIVIILSLSALQVTAQKSKDILYLKNGSIINGTLIEIRDNQYKMRTNDGSIFIFKSEEVDKFLKDIQSFEGRKESGSGYSLEAGVLIGAQNDNDIGSPLSINIIAGKTFRTRNFIGAGSGVEFIGRTYAPVFLEYNRLMGEKKSAPFIFVRAGNLFHFGGNGTNDHPVISIWPQPYVESKYRGGLTLTAGTGISWSKEDYESYISFAYRYATTREIQIYEMLYDVTYKNYYNRLEIKMGIKF